MGATLHSIFVFAHAWWVELLCAVLIGLVLPIIAGCILLVERKVMAEMQAGQGTTSRGPHGLLHSMADALKLLFKEDLVPCNADRFLFWLGPIVSIAAVLISMGAISFGPWFQVARDINIGLLFVVGVSTLYPLGLILGGEASNDHHSILGALRSTAELISYETTAGFAVLSGFLFAGTLNVRAIVETQRTDQAWYIFLAPAGFFTYFVASLALSNRAPFDVPEAESELNTGHLAEYRGFRWALYSLAERADLMVIASVGTTLFLGGWLRPFPNVQWLAWLDVTPTLLLATGGTYCVFRAVKQPVRLQSLSMWTVALACLGVAAIFALAAPLGHLPLQSMHDGLYGAFWFLLKVFAFIYAFVCLRRTLLGFRFDEQMRLGWHILIPLALINLVDVGIALALSSEFGLNRWIAMVITTVATVLAGLLLLYWDDKYFTAASVALAAESSTAEEPNAG